MERFYVTIGFERYMHTVEVKRGEYDRIVNRGTMLTFPSEIETIKGEIRLNLGEVTFMDARREFEV